MPKVSVIAIGTLSLAAALIGSAQAADATATEWRSVAYSCESGESLTVTFRDSGSAIQVSAADQPAVKLNARPADAGFRYGDSRHELRGTGESVTWAIGRKAPVKCTSQDPAAAQLAAVAAR